MNTRLIIFFTATAALALGGAALQPAAAQQGAAASAGIVHGTAAGHAYQSGGIGSDQAAEMRRGNKPYDLQLSLSEGHRNAYAAGVKLSITGDRGVKVFSLGDAGPLVDVDLPAGHYHVLADFGRIKRMGSVDVEKGQLATLFLHGPEAAF